MGCQVLTYLPTARDVAVRGGGGARSPAARVRRATSLASATEGLLPLLMISNL